MVSISYWQSGDADFHRCRPRSLSLGADPLSAVFEASNNVAVVVKGPFYDLERVMVPIAGVESRISDGTLPMKWSEEDEKTTIGSDNADCLVELSSDVSGESEQCTGWWVPIIGELTECQEYAKPVKSRSRRRRTTRPREFSTESEEPTTLMLRNLSSSTTTNSVVELLEREGFAESFDFVYAPAIFKTGLSVGYAIANMTDHATAVKAIDLLQGVEGTSVSWNNNGQGLDTQIARYRNSPVMHASVADERKPMLFSKGLRVVFPQPTRTIKAPRSNEPRDKHLHSFFCYDC